MMSKRPMSQTNTLRTLKTLCGDFGEESATAQGFSIEPWTTSRLTFIPPQAQQQREGILGAVSPTRLDNSLLTDCHWHTQHNPSTSITLENKSKPPGTVTD